MSYWCLQLPPKTNDNKSHSSKIELFRSFFGGNVGLKKSFRFCLTFSMYREKNCKFGQIFCFQSFQCKLSSDWIISFLNPDRKIYVLAPINKGYASLLACWKPTKLFSLNKFALQKFAWLNIGLALLGLHRVEFEKKNR